MKGKVNKAKVKKALVVLEKEIVPIVNVLYPGAGKYAEATKMLVTLLKKKIKEKKVMEQAKEIEQEVQSGEEKS